jgi:class 3 adenylate cyclase
MLADPPRAARAPRAAPIARLYPAEGCSRLARARDDTVTLLFTDIVGSTALLERLGDRAWVEMLDRHSTLVRRHVAVHGGEIVQVLGDGFMLAFTNVADAVGCAVGIQRDLDAAPDPALDTPLRVRMGVHTGPVLRSATDLHGRTVVLAARIAAHAVAGQILVSEAVASSRAASTDIRVAARGAVALKGLHGRQPIYALDWSGRPGPVPGVPPIVRTAATRSGPRAARLVARLFGVSSDATRDGLSENSPPAAIAV